MEKGYNGVKGSSKAANNKNKLDLTDGIYKITPKEVYQALQGYEPINKFKVSFRGFEVRAQRSISHMSDKQLIYSFKKGYSGRDKSGDTIILHHHEQRVEGPIIEMPYRFHDLGNKKQHPLGNLVIKVVWEVVKLGKILIRGVSSIGKRDMQMK